MKECKSLNRETGECRLAHLSPQPSKLVKGEILEILLGPVAWACGWKSRSAFLCLERDTPTGQVGCDHFDNASDSFPSRMAGTHPGSQR